MARWHQGEHVAIVGDTGSGKTYLLEQLLQYRRYVIVCRTKSDDIPFAGYKHIRTVDGLTSNDTRFVLYPKRELATQRYQLARAISLVERQRAWCLAIDELYYVTEKLRLGPDVDMLLTQGRGEKISVVCGMQRPSRISRFALSMPTHWFIFQSEGRDVQTLVEAGTERFKRIVPNLKQYEFVYWNRITRELVIAKTQQLGELLS